MTGLNQPELPHAVRFAEKWIEWIQYKKEIKDSYKSPKSASAKAKQLAKYSEDVAVAMIEQSIANGHKGIFPLKENGKSIEPKEVYKPEGLKVNGHIPNDYKAKEFNRNEYREKVKADLTAFYNNGTPILDAGNIMHQKLTDLKILTLPQAQRDAIRKELTHEHTRHRTRFEDPITGSLESEIKRQELLTFLEQTKKDNRNILLEI